MPMFLKTKTVPQMTAEELREAQAYYGPNHKRAKAIEKEMAKRAPASANEASQQKSSPAYEPPSAKNVFDDWVRDGKSAEHPDYEPTDRQQMVMDAVARAVDGGLFYNTEVKDRVAKEMGYTGSQDDGTKFSLDVYMARKVVEKQRGNARSRKIAQEMNLQPGDNIGTIVPNDYKRITGLTVESVSETGFSVTVKGKRGAATVSGQMGVDSIKSGIERAKEKGLRKDSYAEFIAKRAPKAPAVAEPKSSAPAAKPKTMQDMAQDLAQAIKQGGWDAYTALRSKLATDANLNVRQTLDLNGLTRSIVGVEFFDTEYAKADPEKAGRSAHARGEAPIPPEGLSEDQKARWLAAWDEGKARKDEQEPVNNDRPGEVVGEVREVSEGKGLPAPESTNQQGAEDGQQVQGQAPAEEVTQQQQDDFLPEGWSKSKNGFTGRAVYRREQGVGKPFAVVTQTEGIAYEVQIRHGDKQLIASDRKGALSEVLAYAQQELKRMTDADSVTHQDPGEKPEAATEGVVTSSLKTAAKNEEKSPSEMRKWLLAEIDKAMLTAADRADYDEAVKRMGEKDAIAMYTGNGLLGKGTETGFLTFDVPGDGKFKVRNSMRGLLEFKKKVSASPGFKDSGQKQTSPSSSASVLGGTKMDAVLNMIEEGDFEAARDYAEAVGIKLEDVKVPRGERKQQWDQFLKDGTVPPPVDTKPQPAQKTAAQLDEEKRQAAEAEAKKPKDTGWNMAGTGYGGKRYIGRNITTADGREIVARVYENAGTYEEAEVKEGSKVLLRLTERYRAQERVDAWLDRMMGNTPALDLMGFKMEPMDDDGSFRLLDGNMVVSVERTDTGLQARHRSAKSSPRLTDQQAVEWAANIRDESRKSDDGDKPATREDYKPEGRTYLVVPFKDKEWVKQRGAKWDAENKLWYADPIPDGMAKGEINVNLVSFIPEDRTGDDRYNYYGDKAVAQAVALNASARDGVEYEVKKRKHPDGMMMWSVVRAEDQAKADPAATDEQSQPQETPQVTEAEARKHLEWRDLGQSDGTKTWGLYFKDADGGTLRYGTVSKYAGSRWEVDGHDGGKYEGLQPAKKKAEDIAVERLREHGYVVPAEAAATPEAQAEAPSRKKAAKPEQKIADFGEKLEGARKDYASTLKDAMEVDVKTAPLSKSWPEPDYQKLLDGGADPFAVSFIHAARDEVPTKPVKAWKLKGWVAQVEMLRDMAQKILSGEVSPQRLREMLAEPKFERLRSRVGGRAELYEAVGHEKSLKGVDFEKHDYALYRGEQNVTKWVISQEAKATAFSNWPREIVAANSKEEALAQFKAKYDDLDLGPKAKGQPQFSIYRRRGAEGAIIGKKIGREYIDLKKFADVKEARAYLKDNLAELEKALEQYKTTPLERRPDNQPRVGEDHRNGAPVTPEVFAETFGFRGVQFGNYVEQARRQSDLNEAYDALMDLAAVLGVPPRALSLNGTLGLAFGARGKGGKGAPNAHFEGDKVVINLTKTSGPGALAHEWWHSVDNYFARQSVEKSTDFVTGGAVTDRMRQKLREAFAAVKAATQAPTLRRRAALLDKRKSKPYWNTPVELSARAFESYVIAKLQDQGAANDYLANIVDPEVWGVSESMRADALGQTESETYPYPLQAELPAVRAAFDDFFKTVETRTDDAGNVAMFSRETAGDGFRRGGLDIAARAQEAQVEMIENIVMSLVSRWKNAPEVVVLGSMAEAPARVRQENERQIAGGAQGVPAAFFYGGKAYVMASEMKTIADVRKAVFHEVLGHLGLRGLYGKQLDKILAQVWNVRRKEVVDKGLSYGLDMNERRDQLLAAEEVLAEMAQTNPSLGFVRRTIAAIRSWLRANVPALSRMKMTDDEIINEFILPAQRFIKEGLNGPRGGMAPAFVRRDAGLQRSEKVDTIDVDGKQRPTKNSNGQPIHPTEDGIRNFWRWFGDSKVVDDQGRPLVVYHGTKADFDGFSLEKFGQTDGGWAGKGFYFAPSADEASIYATSLASPYASSTGANVMPVYLSAQSPLEWQLGKDGDRAIQGKRNELDAKAFAEWVQAEGHDSVHITSPDIGKIKGEDQWLVFAPTQIKSATGNSGAFDPDNADIGFSRTAAAEQYTGRARELAQDFLGSAGTKVDWLDRTFKTQYAKAQKFPEFGKVFNRLQQYIESVSSLANQAADRAPSILPKLESVSDLWKHGIWRHGLKAEDKQAIAAPIFEGTLEWARKDGKLVRVAELEKEAEGLTTAQKESRLLRDRKVRPEQVKAWKASKLDVYEGAITNAYEREYLAAGVVFTDAELRDRFGLTPEQIGQYREFREAVNESLDEMAAAEVVRLVPDLPADVAAMAETAEGRKGLREAVEAFLGDENNDLWNQVQDKFNQAEKLKDRGYAPLSRFGKFYVHVVDDTGATQFFGLAETRYKANALAREMRGEFPGATVDQGVMSQQQYKLMSAVPLDSMELFASAIGAEQSEVFQKYIQLAKNNRSTMKRLIRRKGTAGFSDDVPRVLANFITSNARAASAALHVKTAKEMAQEIKAGDVKDEAVKLIEAVTEPEESGAAIRGLMFTNFIGGSIASAFVNVTQPFMMTFPYLSQWGGASKAAARLVEGARMAVTRAGGDAELRAALKRAEDDGIVSPQEIHHLIERAVGGLADKNPVIQKLAFVWGAPFSLAEQFNRRASFIAAYRTAKEEGIADPFQFAEKAVIETQGLYNAGNKPNAARGVAGATAMTFKQYSIHYLEWLSRMARSGKPGQKAALLALAMLFLAAGADGLPFMDDMDDVIDTVGQAMGYDTNTKRWRHQAASAILGDELGEVATRGFSAIGGFPLDVSMRMGMGNLLPATDLLMKSNTDTARSLSELAGPGGALFMQYRDAAKLVLSGDIGAAAQRAFPVALQNVSKGAQMALTGEYRDQRDRKVTDADLLDAGVKALGFQPAEIARESGRMADLRQSESLARMTEAEITDKWARAIVDGDREAEKEALAMRDDWNEKNPDMPIVVKRSQAIRKARQMRMDRKDRFLKTVAPERRKAAQQEMDA